MPFYKSLYRERTLFFAKWCLFYVDIELCKLQDQHSLSSLTQSQFIIKFLREYLIVSENNFVSINLFRQKINWFDQPITNLSYIFRYFCWIAKTYICDRSADLCISGCWQIRRRDKVFLLLTTCMSIVTKLSFEMTHMAISDILFALFHI